MAEETWHAARLIPTSGISGAEEQERRATSALLAVMSAVKEFARAILFPLGAPSGTVEAFIEVPFTIDDHRVFPDGLVRVRRGSRSWVALVEVKTGSSQLDAAQLETYLDVAREQGFNAVLTISNQIPAMAGSHPTPVDKRKLKKVALHHLSWTQILTEAVMQKVHRGVADPDQAWILGELIRYLEHPRSGAMESEDMGAAWVTVRDAVAAGTLRPNEKGAAELASRWDQLIRYACLRLGRQLGVEVQPVLSRKELAEPASRAQALIGTLVSHGRLEGAIRIPHAVGPIEVAADLRSGRISAAIDIDAPREGRPQTRVNWLIRQLKGAPDSERRSSRPGRSVDRRSGAVLDLLDLFYESIVQTIKPWAASPPKLRTEPLVSGVDVPTQLVSTSLSSQDGAEPLDSPASDDPQLQGPREQSGLLAIESEEPRGGGEQPPTPCRAVQSAPARPRAARPWVVRKRRSLRRPLTSSPTDRMDEDGMGCAPIEELRSRSADTGKARG
jgi:hypothetical protein